MKDVVETLQDEMDVWRERAERAEARLASITGMQRQELARDVAKRQREACAEELTSCLRRMLQVMPFQNVETVKLFMEMQQVMLNTPLVTEVDK